MVVVHQNTFLFHTKLQNNMQDKCDFCGEIATYVFPVDDGYSISYACEKCLKTYEEYSEND